VITAAAESLRAAGETVLLLREPGGTAVGEAVRAVLLNPELRSLCAESELLLMMASRAQLVRERILPALERGDWVLCDRFTDASFAYQGGGRGIDSGRIAELERWVAGLKPGLSFLLDLPVETGLARAGSRAAPDRIESESIAFFERVRASYRTRAAAEPQRWCVLDASQPAEIVAAAVVQRLNVQREAAR
jgi:dTMP kinase